jgi:sirohydrochlorin cobaltochelatase
MRSAPLVYDEHGRVAWDRVWRTFCDLALAGGPPHRGTLLEPPSREDVLARPNDAARVVAEMARGLSLITRLPVLTDCAPGWVGLACADEEMAVWLLRAIVVEHISVRREGTTLFLPAGPAYRIDKEIKNVITAVAKTHHYWTEHRTSR